MTITPNIAHLKRQQKTKQSGFRILTAFGLLIIAVALLPFAWQAWVNWRYQSRLFTIDDVPQRRVAIVFGARVYDNERLSAMLKDRVDTAIDLYHAGAVDKLLVTGDNSTESYNEPGAMMNYAIEKGVDPDDIQPDFGGRRTYDSCYRAKYVFQLDEVVLVTQEFHLPRALFLCSSMGLDSVGVIADRRQYDPRSIAWSEMREIPALLVALTDTIGRIPPPVLGEPIPIN